MTHHAETAVEKTVRSASRWSWISRGIFGVLILSTVAFGAYLATANVGARAERVELVEQLDQERAKVDALYEQLQSLGEDPVVDPGESINGTAGPTGPQGIQGVPGEKGDPGLSAAPVTPDQIAAAVAAYCAANNGCRGPAGTNGIDGTDGAPGAPGAAGATGSPGISVVAVTCVVLEDLSTAFQFTLSDGMLLNVTGPCTPTVP